MELKHDPAVLVLSRRPMPTLDRSVYAPASGVRRGAYVLADPQDGDPEVILMATGTEVQLAVAAYEQLSAEGVRARVVSMPSWNLFERQDEDYREPVLPRAITARVGVEQASDFGWDRYVGPTGHDDRDAQLRHVGAAEGPPAALRVHARGGGRRGAGAAGGRVGLGDDPST